MFINYKISTLKFQTNWMKQCRDIGMLKSLFFILHNRRAVGKIVGQLSEIKLVTSLFGELKKCRKSETDLVSTAQ